MNIHFFVRLDAIVFIYLMKKLLIFIVILLIIIILSLGFISPTEVSLPVYLLIFVQLYCLFVLITLAFMKLFYRDTNKTRRRFIAITLAFIPVGILALGSLSRLTFVDVVLVIMVPLLIVWYAVKRGVLK